MDITGVQEGIRGVYPGQKWLTPKDARSARKERDSLLQSLSAKVKYSFKKNKIHIGELSRGCSICGNGYFSCMFINGFCTANCFYCSQDRTIKTERRPFSNFYFDRPDDYVAYLKIMGFKGVGFSGGETLIVLDRLLTYIKKIRKKFGESMCLWIYTNGQLVDREKLIKLREAGLDEIRFNISANHYRLRQIELAAHIIPTVTVEIPAIPEDLEILKKSLEPMKAMGVKFLNIHQLGTTRHNYRNYIHRGYTFLRYPSLPIFESEISALKLIKYALDQNIGLPIQYCSSIYKDRLQGKGHRERCVYATGPQAARALSGGRQDAVETESRCRADRKKPSVRGSQRSLLSNFEALTESRYIRRLSIQDSWENIKALIKGLPKNGSRRELWSFNETKTGIVLHPSLLKDINFDRHPLNITYFEPRIRVGLKAKDQSGVAIKLTSNKSIYIVKQPVFQQELRSKGAIHTFEQVSINKKNWNDALNDFFRSYPLTAREDLQELEKESRCLRSLREWEEFREGFSEVF